MNILKIKVTKQIVALNTVSMCNVQTEEGEILILI